MDRRELQGTLIIGRMRIVKKRTRTSTGDENSVKEVSADNFCEVG